MSELRPPLHNPYAYAVAPRPPSSTQQTMPSPQQPRSDPPRSKKWILPTGAIGFLLFLPSIFVGVQDGWPGEKYLVTGTLFSLLLVGLGLAGSATNRPQANNPGAPAGFGQPPYGFGHIPGDGMFARLRAAPSKARSRHRNLLLAPLALVGLAGLLVLAAIVVGPLGVKAVGSGLGIMVGALFLLAAYAVGAYRALLPTAIAVAFWGLLIEAQVAADAWGIAHAWDTGSLLLLVFFVPVQALGAEAAFRTKKPFWAAWTAIGSLLAAAYPVWLFLGQPGDSQIPLAMTLASFVWGIAANFAFVPQSRGLRWTGVTVFALWSATLLATYAWPSELASRLQAAGLVAAAAVIAITFVAYYVTRYFAKAAT